MLQTSEYQDKRVLVVVDEAHPINDWYVTQYVNILMTLLCNRKQFVGLELFNLDELVMENQISLFFEYILSSLLQHENISCNLINTVLYNIVLVGVSRLQELVTSHSGNGLLTLGNFDQFYPALLLLC
jgi:hypothetical protein